MNINQYSDKELFSYIKEKGSMSDKAFSEIYHRYSDRIYHYCLRILGSTQDAKDIFQETFITFYQKIDSYDSSISVGALLFTIARNFSINFNKKHKLLAELDEEMISTGELDQENKEAIEMISLALEYIPFYQKEAFILRHYQGLSYEEIEKITMTDQATIRNRVKRAIDSLQNILKPYFEELDHIAGNKLRRKRLINKKENN